MNVHLELGMMEQQYVNHVYINAHLVLMECNVHLVYKEEIKQISQIVVVKMDHFYMNNNVLIVITSVIPVKKQQNNVLLALGKME